jgi:tetratricopeptide (TPR) repeat protein
MSSQPDQLALARHYLESGNAKRAFAELEKGAGAAIDDEEFWSIRAQALFELQRWSEAADAGRRGLELEHEDVELLDVVALCEFHLDNNDEADKQIRAALEIWPDHSTLLAHHALILAHRKKWSESERVLAEALAIDPESSDVLLTRSQIATLRGQHNLARQYADDLLAEEPDDELSHLVRANADLQSMRFKQAVRHLEESARLNPERAEIRETLRDARVGAHPLLAPIRPIWRFGRLRSWMVYITIGALLAAARLQTLRYVIAGVWVTLCVVSWVAPPLLRRWYDRKGHV